ncbi:MAG: DUF6159 family protein [Bacteroidota bacterium]
MKFFDRLGRGWTLGIQSLKVIRDHPKLLVFPVLSGLSMIAILLTFGGAFLGLTGFDMEVMNSIFERMEQTGDVVFYAITFAFYLVTYFIVFFFNVALVYNVRQIFAGETPSIRAGLNFSTQRIHRILAWSILAATVGMVLQAIEERVGSLVTSILGFAWSLSTYFVLPVLAADDIGPFEALKRSARTMKNHWGESIGVGFSLGIFVFIGIALAVVTGLLFGSAFGAITGLLMGFIVFVVTIVVNSAARNVFLTAVYEHTQDHTPQQFAAGTLDEAFYVK